MTPRAPNLVVCCVDCSESLNQVRELLKFAVPTDDDIPWLLREANDASKLALILAPMASSKIFAPSKGPTTPNKVPAKAKAKAKAKNKAAKAASLHWGPAKPKQVVWLAAPLKLFPHP